MAGWRPSGEGVFGVMGVYFLLAAPPDWSWKINQRLPFGMNQLQSEEDAPFSPLITSFSSATGSQIPELPTCLSRNDGGWGGPPPPPASSQLLLAWRLSGHRGPGTGGLCQLLVWAGREGKKKQNRWTFILADLQGNIHIKWNTFDIISCCVYLPLTYAH